MNREQYVTALNESKDRNDKLKSKNLELLTGLLEVELLLEDYEGGPDDTSGEDNMINEGGYVSQ